MESGWWVDEKVSRVQVRFRRSGVSFFVADARILTVCGSVPQISSGLDLGWELGTGRWNFETIGL